MLDCNVARTRAADEATSRIRLKGEHRRPVGWVKTSEHCRNAISCFISEYCGQDIPFGAGASIWLLVSRNLRDGGDFNHDRRQITQPGTRELSRLPD